MIKHEIFFFSDYLYFNNYAYAVLISCSVELSMKKALIILGPGKVVLTYMSCCCSWPTAARASKAFSVSGACPGAI